MKFRVLNVSFHLIFRKEHMNDERDEEILAKLQRS